MNDSRIRIAVDVDGVLANQITGILARINPGLVTPLSYEDITDWRYEFEGSDIATEILDAMRSDPSYVIEMPTHDHAKEMLEAISKYGDVVILTARPVEAMGDTEAWLDSNGLTYDSIVSAKEALKSSHGADILIDDYLGNAIEYLSNTHGICIVVDQPWNRDRGELRDFAADSRVFIAKDLSVIPEMVGSVLDGM